MTAVAAYNEETALAALAGARVLGAAVSGERDVIGVDDIPTTSRAAPPLTTIAFGLTNAGRHVVGAVTGAL
ncbi:substrate-binding domain-containing protein [Streptomyces mirabilis]|uniref:substrate-binding domain-containing protein n=1 Tax=Streptomyces mirabilis TaxID=68239 RepID=UPI00380B085B